MNSITALWMTDKEMLHNKSLSQILSFAGDGKLRDGNSTSLEFREFLGQIPSSSLSLFSNSCLQDKFDDAGLALQDVINQIGARLGFSIQQGLYRGKQSEIGFDGIWNTRDGHSIIVEVKTTDVYRINLDTIANYRLRLIEEGRASKTDSSILIVVGRQDTGDLEAQIRGSKHAWDIRLISTDSLLSLLALKESLDDARTIQQINELLKPTEYTRIDKLIDLIFLASKDLQLEEPIDAEIGTEDVADGANEEKRIRKFKPVSFHDDCLQIIQRKLGRTLVKQSRSSFADNEKSVGLICAISRNHPYGKNEQFWFAFHPHQRDMLKEFRNAYVAYGCGSAENTFLIPFADFEPLLKNLYTTEKDGGMYWHVTIRHLDNRFLLQQPRDEEHPVIDIGKYKL